MRQMGIWFFLSCKRCLKKLSFVIILAALPAAAFALRQLEKEEGQEVRIAVCVEAAESVAGREGSFLDHGGEAPLEWQLAESLVQRRGPEGLFRFYLCDSPEQVKDHVASRQAECGYVLGAYLREKLDSRDYRRCIQVYSAPSTVLAQVSTEIVSAALMELYDREIFVNAITESQLVRQAAEKAAEGLLSGDGAVSDGQGPDETEGAPGWFLPEGRLESGGEQRDPAGLEETLEKTAGNLYDKWMGNQSTFRFEYGYRDLSGREAGEDPAPRVFPVRGMAAVYLFLIGLYSAVVLGADEERGLFGPLTPGKKKACSLAVLAAPVFLGAVSCLGALLAGGCMEDTGREIGMMALYSGEVCMFSWGAKSVCRRPRVLCCLIPVFAAGSLLFTPVILDIRQLFPELGWVEMLFLPSCYLRAFY